MGKYWDIKRPLSYNCLYNFIIGMRGVGKTYGSLKYAVEQCIKAREEGLLWEFVYMRRRENELKHSTIGVAGRPGTLFKDIEREFPEHDLRAKNNVLTLDGEVFGYGWQLSETHSKSVPYPNVRLIIYDEFITAARGNSGYIKDEVTVFNEDYETIARPGSDRPRVPVLFLSNAVSISNPFFDYYRLDRPYQGDIQRFGSHKQILVQDVTTKEMIREKAATEFYQINREGTYYNYAVENEWMLDDEDFIEKKTQRSKYFVTLRYNDSYMGIYYDMLQCIYYVSSNVDLNFPHIYSATTDDHKPNMMLLKNARKMGWFGSLVEAYECGAVRYESMKLKNQFRDIMRMVGR